MTEAMPASADALAEQNGAAAPVPNRPPTPAEAPPALTDGQVAHYVEQGFLLVENLFGEDELAELKADLIKLARGGYPCANLEALPADASDAEAMRRILCIHMPHFLSPVVRRYTTHPALAAVLGRIVGAHLRDGLWDGAVKCMQSMFFAKPPGKPGQAWHQDEIYIPTRDRSLCGVWVAIDDATLDNGCLQVLPGSHRRGVLHRQRPHERTDEFDLAPESFGFDSRGEIPVPAPAGSAIFFNGYLLHRSFKNRSGNYRRALVNHYMSAQSLLPWLLEGAEAEAPVASADNRAVHVVCGSDPYADAGYRIPENAVWLRQYEE